MSTSQQTRGKRLAVIGAWLQLGFVIGVLATIGGMMNAFQILGAASAKSDPSALSAAIGGVLLYAFIGTSIALVGFVLACIALFYSRYRAPWFFWFHLIYAVSLLMLFPIGTVIGIGLLCYLLPGRAEFFPQPSGLE